MKALYFQCAARSALGLVRNGNEDSALIGSQVIAVADGMGGHAGGEVASSVAINTLSEIAPTFTSENIDLDSASDLYLNSLHTIDAQIRAVASDEPALAGMGTTLTSLFISGAEVSLLHIGDSRAYRLRGNTFEQLSADHTVLQELLDKGENVSLRALEEQVRSRDERDMNRDVSPLLPAEDAIELDTSELSIQEVMDTVLNLVYLKGLVKVIDQ